LPGVRHPDPFIKIFEKPEKKEDYSGLCTCLDHLFVPRSEAMLYKEPDTDSTALATTSKIHIEN
jgi:hypothetical protein